MWDSNLPFQQSYLRVKHHHKWKWFHHFKIKCRVKELIIKTDCGFHLSEVTRLTPRFQRAFVKNIGRNKHMLVVFIIL